MKSQYAIFDKAGQFVRFEQIDPATVPVIPMASDGLPRAVHAGTPPACPDGKGLAFSRAGWVLADAPEPEPPTSVTRRQMHRWLIKAGVSLDGIRAKLSAMPEPDRSLALIDFEAATYEQTNPLLQSLAAQMGISVADAFLGASKE